MLSFLFVCIDNQVTGATAQGFENDVDFMPDVMGGRGAPFAPAAR